MLFKIIILIHVKVKVIGMDLLIFTLYFYLLGKIDVFIGENSFKDIHLILFRTFLPKFVAFECGSFSEVYSGIKRYVPLRFYFLFWYDIIMQ